MSPGRDDHQAALRDLVAAIAEVAAPPYRGIGPDPDVTRRQTEEFRDLQRNRAHQVASAARHVTDYDPSPEIIHAHARGCAGMPGGRPTLSRPSRRQGSA